VEGRRPAEAAGGAAAAPAALGATRATVPVARAAGSVAAAYPTALLVMTSWAAPARARIVAPAPAPAIPSLPVPSVAAAAAVRLVMLLLRRLLLCGLRLLGGDVAYRSARVMLRAPMPTAVITLLRTVSTPPI